MATGKDKIRASAQKYLQKGQVDKAIREYYRLVETDPKDVRTLLKIGDLQARSKQFDDATETYGKVARFYSEQGFFLKAVAVYKQILKLQPTLVEVNRKLAELYHQLGLVSDATNQYRQISLIYEKQGKLDDAAEILQCMVELDPENVPGRIKLAEIYARTGKTAEARADFHKAAAFLKSQHRVEDYAKVAERIIHHDPTDFDTARELADIYIQQGDARRALAKLQVCFRADPKDIETLTLLAEAFRELGQTKKTLSVLRELMRTQRDAGHDEAAQRAARKILQLAPTDEEALALGGGAAEATEEPLAVPEAEVIGKIVPKHRPLRPPGEVTEINPAVDDAQSASPGAADTARHEQLTKLLVETDIYIKYGLRAKALEHLNKIFAINPTLREAREKHKELLLEDGDTEGAVGELFALASTAVESGDPSAASRDLDELLELQPDHSGAQEMLAQLALEVVAAITVQHAKPPAGGVEEDVAVEFDDVDDDAVEIDLDVDVAEAEEESDREVVVEVDVDEDGAVEVEVDVELAQTETEVAPEVEIELPEGDAVDEEIELVADADEPDSLVSGETVASIKSPRPSQVGGVQVREMANELSQSGVSPSTFDPAATGEHPVASLGAPPLVPTAAVVAETAGPQASGDVATALDDEMGEITFFIEQGLLDEAREGVDRLLATYPGEPRVLALQAQLNAGAAADVEVAPAQAHTEPEPDDEPEIDFVADLTEELDQSVGDGDVQMSFANVFDEFKKGVAEQIEETDYDTHYNLGIAYREMGLLGDAIREFSLAMSSPEMEISALTLLGLCWLEEGNTQEALRSFQTGLTSQQVTPAGAVALRYEIASAYEGTGRFGEALKFYQKAASLDATFRDVAARVVEVSKLAADESSTAVATDLDELLEETPAEAAAQGKISYV